ncbi:hypothetical protein [Pseudochrobactrum sp. HB0163]|uniref:hypothetical protein n=1 Tax=Pseudochrobactrum sp. HB0163 TaxID=3450708 RepID=UPI003F6E37D5
MLDHEIILQELERIENSEAFIQKPRVRQFLRFVVLETLAGKEEGLKASSIGYEVFGRNEPDDAFVRTTAGRLRSALRDYYLSEGKDAKIEISIPKGQYSPVFTATDYRTSPPIAEKKTASKAEKKDNNKTRKHNFKINFIVLFIYSAIIMAVLAFVLYRSDKTIAGPKTFIIVDQRSINLSKNLNISKNIVASQLEKNWLI